MTTIVVATSIGVTCGPGAEAHDSLAPEGSPHTWLPQEDWVAYHWIPFDEQTLKRALGLRGRELEAYLYDDHHTLAELAERRGLSVAELADALIAPWRSRVDDQRLALLRDRTLRVLTQGHLAQHLFFHVFHNGGASLNLAEPLGISAARLRARRADGLPLLQIARRQGVSEAVLTAHMSANFRMRRQQGIDLRYASAVESNRLLERQLRALSCWLRRQHPARDAGNPYGKARLQHGVHRAGWPATVEERSANEVRAEGVRRSLQPSCWRRPPRWRWTPHAPSPRAGTASRTATVCRLESAA